MKFGLISCQICDALLLLFPFADNNQNSPYGTPIKGKKAGLELCVCWVANQYVHADLSSCLLPNGVYNSCVLHAFLSIEELIQLSLL